MSRRFHVLSNNQVLQYFKSLGGFMSYGLKLVKASLESNNALTNVFLGKKQQKLFNFGPLETSSFRGFILPGGYTGFIDHCNTLIDELVDNGITPYVTLLHFDLPQGLEDKYLGPLNRSFVDDFKAYTEICLRTFGDRVKNWITINEQLNTAKFGYDFELLRREGVLFQQGFFA
ncbi:hypothetical protein L3X38_014197 [Prunus dulcis]|uniref:Uncharacterized protein n=1 Tax=Prunus dulcis TaxID=3755 RepID=A0AAD4WNB4_PRUDU|nr:hypothetical protein L3X38_014197 [Prunus dulcis]